MQVSGEDSKVEPEILLTSQSQDLPRLNYSPVSDLSSGHSSGPRISSKTYDVIGNRPVVWTKLFTKYSEEMPNDFEVDLETLSLKQEKFSSPSSESEAEEVSEDEVECPTRTPMRKAPAWIRHWVETGKSPYRDISEGESGEESSLSETGLSRCRTVILGEDGLPCGTPSLYSSVDTVVYILSNTNVTNKSEAQAIVEGSHEPLGEEFSTFRRCSRDIAAETPEILNNIISKDPAEDQTASTSRVETPFKSTPTEKVNNSEPIVQNPEKKPVSILKPMKITDALLTLEQIAKINTAVATDDGSTIFSSAQKSPTKPSARKKLYTGRNSPMDVIFPTVTNRSRINGNFELHPALMKTPRTQLTKRRIGRSLKNRISRIFKIDPKEKSAEKPSANVDNFFSSLGLTPSDKGSPSRQIKSMTVLPCKDDEKTTESKTRLSTLEKLCAMKQPRIILERVSTHLPVNHDVTKHNNDYLDSVKKDNVSKSINGDSPLVFESLQNNSSTKEVQNVDLDSLKSDQSTILIYKCARETGQTKNKASKVDKQKTDAQKLDSSLINSQRGKKSLESQQNEKINSNSPLKRKRECPSFISRLSSASEDDSSKKIDFRRQSAKRRSIGGIKILSNSDEFLKTVQKNLETTIDSSKLTDKSANSLDHDESRLTGEMSAVVAPSALEIVLTEGEDSMDERSQEQRPKRVAKRRNSAKPSNEAKKPVQARTRSLRKRKFSEVSPENPGERRKSAAKRLKFSSDSEESSAEILPLQKKLKSPPSSSKIVKNVEKKDLANGTENLNDSIAVLNARKAKKNKIEVEINSTPSPIKNIILSEVDDNRRITRNGKKLSQVASCDTIKNSSDKLSKIKPNRNNLNDSSVKLKNLSVSLSRIRLPLVSDLRKKTRSKSFPMDGKILSKVNKIQKVSNMHKLRSSERIRKNDNKKMSSSQSRLNNDKNYVQKLKSVKVAVVKADFHDQNQSNVNDITSEVFPSMLDSSVEDAMSFFKTLRSYKRNIDNRQHDQSIKTLRFRTGDSDSDN